MDYKNGFRSLILLVLHIVFTNCLFAFTTPGTGVFWNADSLVNNSDGIITWSFDANRYESTEELEISESDTVLIDDDFYSSHDDDPDFLVYGMLIVGSLDSVLVDSVILSGDEVDGPGGIKVEEGGEAILTQVIYEGGGYTGDIGGRSAVKVSDGSIDMNGCRITNWDRYAVNTLGGSGTVENCLFHDNHQWTVEINLDANLTLRNCTFLNCNLEGTSPKNPISIGTQGFNTALIEDCHISGEVGDPHGGISIWNFLGTGADVTIRRTTVENLSYGMIANGDGVEVLVTDSEFLNNNIHPNPMVSGSGITVQYGAHVTAARNTITGNHWGITVYPPNDPGTILLGDNESEIEDEQGRNFLYDNGNNDEVYNFYNNSPDPALAQNNWWGSTDVDDVEDGIFHNPDDGTLGEVTYLPLWDPEANEPPVIISFEPQDTLLDVLWGDERQFTITADDPEGDSTLTYEFTINGETVSNDSTANIVFENGFDWEVVGTVTDDAENSVSVHWYVTVINQAPEIGTHLPEEPQISEPVGTQINFSMIAEDPEMGPINYFYNISDEQGDWVVEQQEFDYTIQTDAVNITIQGVAADTFLLQDDITWEIEGLTSVNEISVIPGDFKFEAFPNPFNSEISLTLHLPFSSAVDVEIYNSIGRRIRQSGSKQLQAGVHNLHWNAKDFATGVYYVNVSAENWSDMKRIVLIK